MSADDIVRAEIERLRQEPKLPPSPDEIDEAIADLADALRDHAAARRMELESDQLGSGAWRISADMDRDAKLQRAEARERFLAAFAVLAEAAGLAEGD